MAEIQIKCFKTPTLTGKNDLDTRPSESIPASSEPERKSVRIVDFYFTPLKNI